MDNFYALCFTVTFSKESLPFLAALEKPESSLGSIAIVTDYGRSFV